MDDLQELGTGLQERGPRPRAAGGGPSQPSEAWRASIPGHEGFSP